MSSSTAIPAPLEKLFWSTMRRVAENVTDDIDHDEGDDLHGDDEDHVDDLHSAFGTYDTVYWLCFNLFNLFLDSFLKWCLLPRLVWVFLRPIVCVLFSAAS